MIMFQLASPSLPLKHASLPSAAGDHYKKVRVCDSKWDSPQCAAGGNLFTDSPQTHQCHLMPSCARRSFKDMHMTRKSTIRADLS